MGPGDERAEVRAHRRHRGGRQDLAARHVLPDERQLLLRRLLQGGGHHPRLGARDLAPGPRRLRAGRRPDLAHRLRGRRRGVRDLARPDRCARGADHPPRQARQLLAHGGARPRGPVQRDLPRPRHGVRPRGRPGRRRGPLPRVLEPRLHAGGALRRPGQGRLRHRRPAAAAQHRHGHGPGAHGDPAPGRRQPLRDRRGLPRPRACGRPHREALRRAVRAHGQRVAPRRRPAARRGRPRALLAHAHRRRRHPRQRGPRLRPAPDAAPGGALDAPPRVRGPLPARAPPDLGGADAAVLPRARHRLRPDQPDRLRGGGGLPAHPHRGDDDPGHGRGAHQGVRRGDPRGRPGVPAARHLRLPDRPDPRDGRRAGARGRPRGLHPADAGAAPAGQGRREVQEVRPREHRGVARPARASGRPTSAPTRS